MWFHPEKMLEKNKCRHGGVLTERTCESRDSQSALVKWRRVLCSELGSVDNVFHFRGGWWEGHVVRVVPLAWRPRGGDVPGPNPSGALGHLDS